MIFPLKKLKHEIDDLKQMAEQADRERAVEQVKLDESMQELRKLLSFDDKIMEIFKGRDR